MVRVAFPAGIDAASVLAVLTGAELRGLLALPRDGDWSKDQMPGVFETLARLGALDVADPSELVSVRLQLVELGTAGVRLTRLGRQMASLRGLREWQRVSVG